MLEPLATSVLSSIFASGRPFTGHPLPPSAAFRMLSRSPVTPFPHDFFTPHPRRKGKERAISEFECNVCRGRSVEVTLSSCINITNHNHLPPTWDFILHESRHRMRHSVHLRREPTRPGSSLSRFSRLKEPDMAQRRHISNRPEPPPPPLPAQQSYIQGLISHAFTGEHPPDMDSTWTAYKTFVTENDPTVIPVSDFLLLADKLLEGADSDPSRPSRGDSWMLWSTRVRGLLMDLNSRISRKDSDISRSRWNALLARAHAYGNNFPEAIRHLRRLPYTVPSQGQEKATILAYAYNNVVLAMEEYLHPQAVLDFLVNEWHVVEFYLIVLNNGRNKRRASYEAIETFRQTVSRIVSMLERPANLIAKLPLDTSPEYCRKVGLLLISSLTRASYGEDACRVLQELESRDIDVPFDQQMQVIRALAKSNSFELANHLYMSLTESPDVQENPLAFVRLGLYLFSHQGDEIRAKECANHLEKEGYLDSKAVGALLHTYSVSGNCEECVKTFDHYFQNGQQPNLIHYTAVVLSFARRGDQVGMNHWLRSLISAGFSPDKHLYNVILDSFAAKDDVQAVRSVLIQMREARIPMSHISATTLITLFANRRDPQSADAVFKQALKDGIVPDRQMLSSLMHAHVQAGSWQGVIVAFDYMRSAVPKGLRLTIEVYNILLKAYVLIGSPFQTVWRLFERLGDVGVRPDEYSYALIIQSACDAGQMRIASDLFGSLEQLSNQWETNLDINVYVLTILMAGYLRQNDKLRAKAVYDDMIARGIVPTSVTYAALVRAYANAQSEESITMAEDFITGIEEMTDPRTLAALEQDGSRAVALQTIYTPLMDCYAKRENLEEVERILEKIRDTGNEQDLTTLTVLLDVHRRLLHFDEVREIWPQIVELANQYREETQSLFEGDVVQPLTPRLSNLLCIPLSIYMDALSSAGAHSEIAVVWQQLRSMGYTFDSHNWNHLIVALIRAGEPERAFEVVERVIVPYREQTMDVHPRYPDPISPIVSDLPPLQGEENINKQQPNEPPLKKKDRRASASNLFDKKFRRWMGEKMDDKEDFTHSLHLLHSISPAWNIWRLHNVTFGLLTKTLAHLRAGKLIQPLGSETGVRINMATTEEEWQNRASQADKVLERITQNCPKALESIAYYEDWQRRRRAAGEFWATRRISSRKSSRPQYNRS
ncbi:hypothetical protein C8Q75DRAFT_846382 [Abortiporus biennis]|nr:hypothetical protein C8Q75DRAFT_846382 [Abortiporus biennis]